MTKVKEVTGQLAVLAVIIATVAITGAGAPTITTNDYAEYTAEVLTTGGNLTLTPQGIDAAAKNKAAAGDTQPTAITMASTGNPVGNTAISKGNWTYKVQVEANGNTPASTDFQVELKVNGTVLGTLYVSSDATPVAGELVTLTFDLGTTTIGSEQSFVIQATAL